MKRLPLIVFLLFTGSAAADEGMWRPRQLPDLRDTLRSMGMTLDPARLSDLLDHPMNAVISLGGCTASFVSPEGLVITNHHCAYGSIQHNSTEERNLLKTGFLARTRSEELPARPGSRIYVTVDVRDVTGEIVEDLPAGLTGRARYQAIEDRRKALVAACEEDPGHRCEVVDYHGGLEYELVKRLEIRDVRLVHAPPGPIGRYGGDVDNWMWPRHTGDYSFYRAYVGRDGMPADYSPDNVPFRPKHRLTVSTEGIRPGSLVFVAGYPARTNRYRLATEVEHTFGWYYPTRKRLFHQWLGIIAEKTADDPDVAIKYAGLIARLNNTAKNYEGMLNGYGRSDMLRAKRDLEKDLERWIRQDDDRKERYLAPLNDLRKLTAENQATAERRLYYDSMARRSDLLRAARRLYRLSVEKEKPDAEREPGYQERDVVRIREQLMRLDRSFDARVDRAAWRQFIVDYAAIPAGQHVRDFDEWFGVDGTKIDAGRLDARLEEMYAGTTLGDPDARLAWMDEKRGAFESSDDPFIRLTVHLFDSDMEIEEQAKDLEGRFLASRPRFMAALIAYLEGQGAPIYPDANRTLRVSYGSVRGYRPRDAVEFTPFTCLRGILEKDTGEDPFDAPTAQLAAIRERRFGGWADDTMDNVPVNFLSTVDATGGNSGSATLNARGELVGLLFDTNWESVISDWDYMTDLSRSIHVDMRYVLWVMDEVVRAHALMREMGVEPTSRTGTVTRTARDD